MGGKGGSNKAAKEASKAAKTLAKIGKREYNRTEPLRSEIRGRGEEFLAGGLDPTASPLYDYGRSSIEDRFDVARQNIISNMPSGGQLMDTMADLEMGRADALSGLEAQIAQDEYNKLYGYATGAPQTSISALGSAGASMSSLAGQEAAAQAQETAAKYGALGDIGGGAGMMFGMKG